jgi:hypothetical protein
VVYPNENCASNSGVTRGAAKLLEDKIGQKLLYLACRHHVLEIVAGAVWKTLFGKIFGPDNKLFSNFKESWNHLIGIQKQYVQIETLRIDHPWLVDVKNRVIEQFSTLLTKEDSVKIPRDDYRECAENCLIILGATPARGIHFMKPGAVHQARWMACNLYGAKMFMFSKQMGYDADMIEKLRRLNVFLNLFYVPLWMKASRGSDAPILDLNFIHDMMDYRLVDPEIADVVLKKLSNHGWYLTEEVVPFVLFSNHYSINDVVKQDIASKLLEMPVPDSFRLGKPLFRKITRNTTLLDLIGPESHALFHTLKIGQQWLSKPVEQWKLEPDFCTANDFVRTVKVVNDTAERGVKLMTDFATCITTDPIQRAALLQAVERHRQLYPDCLKSTLNA